MIAQSLTKGNEQWLPPLGGAIAHLHYPTHCSLLIATPTASVQLGGSGLSCGGGELIAYEGWASRLGPRPSRIRPWLSRLGPMGCQPSYGGSMRAVSPWALAFPQRVYGVVRAVFQNPPVCPVTARYPATLGRTVALWTISHRRQLLCFVLVGTNQPYLTRVAIAS
jgi:hypothetical protein